MTVDPREELAYAHGIEAYIWGLPLVEMVRTCKVMTAVAEPQPTGRSPINSIGHCDHCWTHRDRDIVTPANDLVYSTAWLNLADGPVVVTVPKATGRYFVVALLDAYTNNFRNLGPRNVGPEGGRFALVGPQWQGSVPVGTAELRCPTDLVMILGRTLADDTTDLAEAARLQHQITVYPTGPSRLPEAVERHRDGGAAEFFASLGRAVATYPPPETERGLAEYLQRSGILAEAVDPVTARGLERAYRAGRAIVDQRSRSRAARAWGVNYKVGAMGSDFLGRAALALKGLGGLTCEEAVYAMSDFDADGRPLEGAARYELRFGGQELPPADAFWSVSLYGEDFYFCDNPIARYAIGDRTKGLRREPDGGLVIDIGHRPPPAGTHNWLPAPAGRFYLILRIYYPRPEVLERRYRIPPVARVS